MSIKKSSKHFLKYLWMLPAVLLITQPVVQARPKLVPGFIYVDNASFELPVPGTNQASVTLTVQNMHANDPLVILSLIGDSLAEDAMLEEVVINPGEISAPISVMVTLADDLTISDDELDLNLRVRRGLEAMEYVEAIEDPRALARVPLGFKLQRSGIPNEDEYRITFDIAE
jgi:hypothetical protein